MDESDTRERREAPGGAVPGGTVRGVDGSEPARRVTRTVALAVTLLFVLVTVVGVGWFLSDGGPLSGAGSDDADAGAEAAGTDESSDGSGQDGGERPTTPVAVGGDRLAYTLPGRGWHQLDGDGVPEEYTSYAVHGSDDDPDALIVTGTRDLNAVEPLSVAGTRLALEAAVPLLTSGGTPWAEPSGEREVDGAPAFGVSVGTEGDEGVYGRFLLVEVDDGTGAFMLGVNTAGGDEATAHIDAAFASVGVR
ncbi:hypothetical protein [Nocardiopsis sp. NRRL B-16309]|uniref:hypothetical protein n=1 Tax=Nocardiopsis sp. NRRL B-16309 TaxID=1519494 RepID=UPI0006AE4A98|nr:hypothetical protein [Nocardiopsis sp. NRRL B-16309]KOX11217.1 hypothetical protein ADL05_23415 [Nocardiopsis sp. NRRL B-16309]